MEPVRKEIEMPLCNIDPELNTMHMLLQCMEFEELTDDQKARIAAWFAAKYGRVE
jgi:hypothetical protein